MGYTARPAPPCWPPLPVEAIYYPAPNPTTWADSRQRRQYRRQRLARHQHYLSAMSWRRTTLRDSIERRLDAGRCASEKAWILDQELARWLGHRRPLRGLCDCECEPWGEAGAWWPFPEDEWEPLVIVGANGQLAGWHG